MKTIIKRILGDQLTGTIAYYRTSSMDIGMGGPFNGQEFRQKIFQELIQSIKFDAIVETGSFHGTTTGYMHERSGLRVYTVESQPRNFGFTKARFRRNRSVFPHLGDSRKFLSDLSKQADLRGKKLFFYLDAHWSADLPLREEVEIIYSAWPDAVVMVDDFKVPDDDGYRYDDYGTGKALEVDYLRPLARFKLMAFFPSTPGLQDTGARRGCIVIARDERSIQQLQQVKTLKQHGYIQ